MTEQEMFAYAAKAADVVGGYSENWGGYLVPVPVHSDCDGLGFWNPRTENGDAFVLLVQLGLDVQWDMECKTVLVGNPHVLSTVPYGDDKEAATREAIFQAAVAIGKAMP